MPQTYLRLGFALILGVVFSHPVSGDDQIKIPETPAGKQLAAWLKAYNSGNRKTWREFIESHFAADALKTDPIDQQLEFLQMFFRDNSKLELVRIERAGEHKIEVLARSSLTELWSQLSLSVQEKSPHDIVDVGVEFPADSPDDTTAKGKLTDGEIARTMEAYVDKLASSDWFSGSVLIARDGKPIFSKACGLASQAFQVPNRLDTKFNLGSMNKMFTALAVVQLAQQDKLAFGDPLIKYLPDYPNKDVASKITVHQLLTHTSGLGDYFNDKFRESSKDRFRTIQDFFPLFVDKPLVGKPGEFRYSNAGFMVLGAVVAKVSGEDYFEYVRNHIYRPSGMINTDAYEMDRDTPNLAIGYTYGRGPDSSGLQGRKNNLFIHTIKGGPAGGGFSTVEDLLRFSLALQDGKLLDKKHAALLMAGKVDMGRSSTTKYAYGFMDETSHGTRIVGHGGGFPGINAKLDIYLDKHYVVAVMSNYDMPRAEAVANKAKTLILQE